ncbi:FAD-dependent monooxygenase [Brachybacterium hainanense]|uniref:FAD-dependent monooxygenase n=1 Tax=Brachybacterium hainanense TaxID=1541174 RepID=A0ABV6RE69_9MICO
MTARIRILGAGVAGLAAAALLPRSGAEVTLVDQDFSPPALGTSLGIFPAAQRALAELGVLDEVRRRSAAPRTGVIRGTDGRVLAQVPAGGALLVPRTDLTAILRAAIPASVRREQRRVRDVRPELAAADVLVGADGLHSLVRRSGWGGVADRARARRHGVTVLRGVTPQPPPEISETWGGSWLFGITPLALGGTNWFAALPEHRASSVAGDLAHLRTVAGGRFDHVDEVLAAASPERTVVHGIATAPITIPVRDHVVLIGDAAHAMTPNLGHGANTALEDALALARCLDGAHGQRALRGALRRYALRRTPPDTAWQLGSLAMTHLAMAEGRRARIRDRVLGSIGPR